MNNSTGLAGTRRAALFVLGALTIPSLVSVPTASADDALALVAEMQRPPGIVALPRAERRRLEGDACSSAGLDTFRRQVGERWEALRGIDVTELSRYHVEVTQGWQWPQAPGTLTGRTIGADPDGLHRYLELQGPRLPASFDIVHRHLTFYARYDCNRQSMDRMTLSIRLEIFE